MDKIYISHYHSPMGRMTMASDGEALIGLWFDGQKYFADTIVGDVEEQQLQVFAETDRWLTLYFQGQKPDFTPSFKASQCPNLHLSASSSNTSPRHIPTHHRTNIQHLATSPFTTSPRALSKPIFRFVRPIIHPHQ